jgi:hypothetical protein
MTVRFSPNRTFGSARVPKFLFVAIEERQGFGLVTGLVHKAPDD